MKNPYKIIHKFKNNNGRIQFQIYIFIGPLVDKEVMNVLESFTKKDFYNTMISIKNKNLKIVQDFYGEKWYEFFFTMEHIIYSIKKINSSPSMRKLIISNLGKEWYEKNINIDTNSIIEKKIPFSFTANYQNYLISRNKIKTFTTKKDMNFKTYTNEDMMRRDEMMQYGGDDDMVDTDLEMLDSVLKKEDDDDEEDNLETFEDCPGLGRIAVMDSNQLVMLGKIMSVKYKPYKI